MGQMMNRFNILTKAGDTAIHLEPKRAGGGGGRNWEKGEVLK